MQREAALDSLDSGPGVRLEHREVLLIHLESDSAHGMRSGEMNGVQTMSGEMTIRDDQIPPDDDQQQQQS